MSPVGGHERLFVRRYLCHGQCRLHVPLFVPLSFAQVDSGPSRASLGVPVSPLLPINTAGSLAANGGGVESGPPDPPSADLLRDWSQETYDMEASVAASLNFAIGQVSTSYSRRVLVFESSRSRDVEADGHTYRFGVALRVVVEVDGLKAEGGLTLPVVAAKVDLEGARATSRLSVRGYKGDDLAALLPTWTSFGVDQYAGYMKAISALQDKIMANSAAIDPELLATTATSVPDQSRSTAEAVALVYGLDALSHGLTLEDALRRLPELDQEIVGIVRQVYAERVGDAERQRPDEQQSERAKEELGGLRLRHGLFI
jgi:hypothetical protein